MSEHVIVLMLLLTAGVGIELICCLALWVMPNVYARLHYLAPASIFGAVMIAAAVAVEAVVIKDANSAIKALLIAAVMMVTSPVITHATARGIHTRDNEHLRTDPAGEENAS